MFDPTDPEFTAIEQYDADIEAAVARANLSSRLGARSIHAALRCPEPAWLIPGFIQREGIHIISSESGTGKTWLALQTMLAGATGTPLLGMEPTCTFDTIFLGADSPEWDIAHQLRQLQLGTGVTFPENSDCVVLPYGLNLLDPEHIKLLLDYITTHNISMIVLDVLLYTYGGADENSNSDMARVFHSLKLLRDKSKCAIVALHHWRKDGNIERGAGTITQAAEHTFAMKRDDHGVLLERRKIRGESDWPNMLLKLQPGEPAGLRFERINPPPPLVLSWFTFKSSLTRDELAAKAKSAGYSVAWLNGQLTSHRKAGTLHSDGKGTWTLATK